MRCYEMFPFQDPYLPVIGSLSHPVVSQALFTKPPYAGLQQFIEELPLRSLLEPAGTRVS